MSTAIDPLIYYSRIVLGNMDADTNGRLEAIVTIERGGDNNLHILQSDGNGPSDIVHAGGSSSGDDSFVRVALNDCGGTTACVKGDADLGSGIVPVNGGDFQPFIQHFYAFRVTGTTLSAADVSGDCTHTQFDVKPFVRLLRGKPAGSAFGNCPPSQQTVIIVDCNRNGIDDAKEIAELTTIDCNTDGMPDECDIASYYSTDANSNGIAGECEEGGQQMMAGSSTSSGEGGGAAGESANSTADTASPDAGETPAPPGGMFDNPAWVAFFSSGRWMSEMRWLR